MCVVHSVGERKSADEVYDQHLEGLTAALLEALVQYMAANRDCDTGVAAQALHALADAYSGRHSRLLRPPGRSG